MRLNFAPCDVEQCVNITIVDNELIEQTEMFVVTLERTATLDKKISLHPVKGYIFVNDEVGKPAVNNNSNFVITNPFIHALLQRWNFIQKHMFIFPLLQH